MTKKPTKKVYSGRSGASAIDAPMTGTKRFKEAKAPEGWNNPAISVRSGKNSSDVYVKPKTTGMMPGFKQSNDRWIKAPKGTKVK